jgi:hypothetical protein
MFNESGEKVGSQERQHHEKWDQNKIVSTLNALLENAHAPMPTKSIYSVDKNLYSAIGRHFRDDEGRIDWASLLGLLTPQAVEKLILPARRREDFTPDTAIATLEGMIDASKSAITPTMIYQKDHSLAKYLAKTFPSPTGGIDWDSIRSRMDPEKAAMISNRETQRRNWDQAITQLVDLMRGREGIFNPRAIKSQSGALYVFFARHARTEGGQIDWSRVARALPDDLQKKFKYPRIVATVKSIEDYPKAAEETETIISKYRDKLHLFFLSKSEISKPERTEREEFCREMVTLAQKGNPVAYQRLNELMMYMVNEWIDENSDGVYKRYQSQGGLAEDKVRACIKNYNLSSDFITYVFVSLGRHALGLPKLDQLSE